MTLNPHIIYKEDVRDASCEISMLTLQQLSKKGCDVTLEFKSNLLPIVEVGSGYVDAAHDLQVT